jgi:hypothetical protein
MRNNTDRADETTFPTNVNLAELFLLNLAARTKKKLVGNCPRIEISFRLGYGFHCLLEMQRMRLALSLDVHTFQPGECVCPKQAEFLSHIPAHVYHRDSKTY